MSINVLDVMVSVSDMLTDEGAQRWSTKKLVGWFNEGQAAIVEKRPDAYTVNESFSCAAGAKQSLPSSGLRLINIVSNGDGDAVTKVDQKIMDAHVRNWRGMTETAAIEHYIYDDRNPKQFYTYPPALDGAALEVIYSAIPPTLNAEDPISLDDNFANALQEYMLFKAWMKDAEFSGNTNRANSHYQQFLKAIGDISQADTAMAPTDG